MAGGKGLGSSLLASTEIYSARLGEWSSVEPLPVPVVGVAGVEYEYEYIFAIARCLLPGSGS